MYLDHSVRSLFVSDLHLGSRYCQPAAFASLLRNVHADRLYLVGDIVDGWLLQKQSSWGGNARRPLMPLPKRLTVEPVSFTCLETMTEIAVKFWPDDFRCRSLRTQYIKQLTVGDCGSFTATASIERRPGFLGCHV